MNLLSAGRILYPDWWLVSPGNVYIRRPNNVILTNNNLNLVSNYDSNFKIILKFKHKIKVAGKPNTQNSPMLFLGSNNGVLNSVYNGTFTQLQTMPGDIGGTGYLNHLAVKFELIEDPFIFSDIPYTFSNNVNKNFATLNRIVSALSTINDIFGVYSTSFTANPVSFTYLQQTRADDSSFLNATKDYYGIVVSLGYHVSTNFVTQDVPFLNKYIFTSALRQISLDFKIFPPMLILPDGIVHTSTAGNPQITFDKNVNYYNKLNV